MTPARKKNSLPESAIEDLASLKDDAARAKYLARRPRLCRKNVVQQLNDIVRTKLRGDTRQALALAEAAIFIARKLRNQEALGRSLRSKANALYMTGDNQNALKFHEQALELFRKIGAAQEAARTLIPSIQPHILLGQYDRAIEIGRASCRERV